MVLLTNIPGVTLPMRAAGAAWINCEGTFAAIQAGWIGVARMRALTLLGARDPGAPRAFGVLLALATGLVALLNVPLLTEAGANALSRLLSNDPDVVKWFGGLVWVLVAHTQSRIVDLTCASLLVPMGWPRTRLAVIFISFWLVGAPLAIVGCLTDLLTSSLGTKLQLCMLCTVVAQTLNAVCYGTLLLRLDWDQAARVIAARANTDRARIPAGPPPSSGGEDDAAPCAVAEGGPSGAEHSIQDRVHSWTPRTPSES